MKIEIVQPPAHVPPVWPALLCIAIPCVASFLPVLGFGVWLLAFPMLLVSFILAVVTMSRGAPMSGLVVLFLTLIVAPIVIFAGPFIGTGLGLRHAEKRAALAKVETVRAPDPEAAAPAGESGEPAAPVVRAPEDEPIHPSALNAASLAEPESILTPKTALAGPDLAAAQRRALLAFPDLGRAGSALNREFVTRVKGKPSEFFARPDWPSDLAAEIQASH